VKAPFLIQNFVNSNRDKENILELRYEDFTSNPERKLVEMLDFLSLESAKLRDFVPSSILNGTFGYQSNARTSSDIFKNDVSWSELEKIKKRKYRILAKNYYRFLGDEFLKEYGSYNVSSQPKSYLSYESRILSKIIKRAEE
jgi:hypothetical protein